VSGSAAIERIEQCPVVYRAAATYIDQHRVRLHRREKLRVDEILCLGRVGHTQDDHVGIAKHVNDPTRVHDGVCELRRLGLAANAGHMRSKRLGAPRNRLSNRSETNDEPARAVDFASPPAYPAAWLILCRLEQLGRARVKVVEHAPHDILGHAYALGVIGGQADVGPLGEPDKHRVIEAGATALHPFEGGRPHQRVDVCQRKGSEEQIVAEQPALGARPFR
jgi:hypothetical protein